MSIVIFAEAWNLGFFTLHKFKYFFLTQEFSTYRFWMAFPNILFKVQYNFRGWRYDSVVKFMLIVSKALGSISSTMKKIKDSFKLHIVTNSYVNCCNPPVSASPNAVITGMCQHAQLSGLFFNHVSFFFKWLHWVLKPQYH